MYLSEAPHMRLEPERKQLFADRLKQAATAKFGREFGLASRVSEMMGVSIATAGRWLRGTVTPEPDRWPELAVKLGVSVAWLTGATHEMPESVASNIPQRDLDLACRTTRAILPGIIRLKPDISADEVEELVRYAYHQLEAGASEKEVMGEVFTRLT